MADTLVHPLDCYYNCVPFIAQSIGYSPCFMIYLNHSTLSLIGFDHRFSIYYFFMTLYLRKYPDSTEFPT